ncbi:glycoside hydrolase superfamily [Chaetomium fimeti]|uniref:Glycoside hydrolase superfamily n=1 Tax=Chaetomium fimeti TaxID=1854472 RepID=A0AAE0LSL4_9PEZI|nr:glycoside hydrolase superfamily [Chaetomium fimeti]
MRLTATLLTAAAAISGAGATPDSTSTLGARQANTITVDLARTYQRMDGFGFSLAFQRANLITNMSDKAKQRELLDLLFNRTTGAGFSILRNGIGSTPNSNSDFMNTIAPTNPGGPNAEPKYQWDGKDSGQLWVSQQAVELYGVKSIYANAWSAPGYMKTNGRDTNGGTLCGVPGAGCSSGDWRQAYADYLVAYVKFYAAAGVNVTRLGFLNEPDFSASYASMQSNGNQAADFIKVLHPTLEAAGLGGQVGITCCDSMGWGNQAQMVNQIRAAVAEGMLAAVTSHTYTGGGGAMNTRAPVWMSEQCDLNGQWTTAWYANGGAGEGLTWANNVYNAVVNTNVSGFLYWEGVQWPNPNTNEKLIRVDNSTNTYEASRRLWAFANWSRYVRPGAVRIGSSGGGNGVRTAAFRNEDGTIAVVAISSGGSASSVNVKISGGAKAAAVQAFVSDNTRNCASTPATLADDGTISGSVAARSITTFFILPAST